MKVTNVGTPGNPGTVPWPIAHPEIPHILPIGEVIGGVDIFEVVPTNDNPGIVPPWLLRPIHIW